MQFGRIQGIGLAVLGGFLLLAQGWISLSSKPRDAPNQASSQVIEHKTTILPGLLGGVLFALGLVLIATARRIDEPEPENAVK